LLGETCCGGLFKTEKQPIICCTGVIRLGRVTLSNVLLGMDVAIDCVMKRARHSTTQSCVGTGYSAALTRTVGAIGLALLCPVMGCETSQDPEETTSIGILEVGAYDQCAHVLEGDLFNKIETNLALAQTSRAILWKTLLALNEDAAYEKYSQMHDESNTRGGGGGLQINPGLCRFGRGGEGIHEQKLTRQAFGEKYHQARQVFGTTDGFDWSASSALASGYASYIRDPATISAWKDCVTAQPQPGLYSFGSRDDAGNAYIQVIWTPGPFAGIIPVINLRFIPQPGLRVVAPDKPQVAVGSGATFAVQGQDTARSFDVVVNGDAFDEMNRLRGSFTSTAKIPPVAMPMMDEHEALCEAARSDALRRGELTRGQYDVYRRIDYAPEYAIPHNRNSEIIGWGECSALFDQL